MIVLGINAYHGDAAACLLVDGTIVAAVEEERLRRVKHWAGFPAEAVRWCLADAGVSPGDVDHVAVGRDPRAHLGAKVRYALRRLPSPRLLLDRVGNTRRVQDLPRALAAALDVPPGGLRAQVHGVEHHLAHLASSFLASPHDTATCVSVDAFGDFVSTMWGRGSGSRIGIDGWIEFPHSLGALYTACTQFLGFDRFGEEYKVMALASYGEPERLEEFRRIVRREPGGRFRLDLDWFRHHRALVDTRWDDGAPQLGRYWSRRWIERFGPPRDRDTPPGDREHGLAASLQAVTEEASFALLDAVGGDGPVCLAGGCAQNSVLNGKIAAIRHRDVFVPPAAADAGTATGAALYVWHHVLGRPRTGAVPSPYLGPRFDDARIASALGDLEPRSARHGTDDALARAVAQRLAAGAVVGWFRGRAEWGPRALGNRSILADPRSAAMRDRINRDVKGREPFRPFAPAVLEERASELFDEAAPVPFMNRVVRASVAGRERIPAAVHVDGTARVQTVGPRDNPPFRALLEAFDALTGVPVLLNTSFNRAEPIVTTPEEALDCARRAGLDALVLGRRVVDLRDRP